MPVEAIIFDFDGTILDTETPDYALWQEHFAAWGLELPAALWSQRVGGVTGEGFDPGEYYAQLTGETFDDAFMTAHVKQYLERCATQPLLPGVLTLIEAATAHSLKLAVASNADRDWVHSHLKRRNLHHYFPCIYTRDDVRHGKPAPDLYLAAAACLGVPVELCVAIEDSPIGMQAALAAGMRCVAVPNWLTAQLERPLVTLTLSSLADHPLDDLLAKLG